jgi:hypothetical protein
MDPTISGALASLFGAVVGGSITFFLNRQLHKHQLALAHEQHKTEFMAEDTARHFLSHKGYTDRSFETCRCIWAGLRRMSCARSSCGRGRYGFIARMGRSGGG